MPPNSSYFNNIVYNMTLITVNSRGDESVLVFLVAGAWGIAVPHCTENRFAAIKKAPSV